MKAAVSSQRRFEQTRLLVVRNEVRHLQVGELSELFTPGDLLVVNRSGTLPASFRGTVERSGQALELRLAALRGEDRNAWRDWAAIAFGAGDWRIPTEARGPAPLARVGDRLRFGPRLVATVTAIDAHAPRLWQVRFSSPQLMRDLYTHGQPIQYAYLREPLRVWDQQTLFSGPPWSVEPPSAAFALNWSLLQKLQANGVRLATLLHGAGLSSTGDPALDARLPLAERYEVPEATLRAVAQARQRGNRVIALGTTVTRALESALHYQRASGFTQVKLGAHTPLRAVTSLLTGMHEEGTSHAELMKAFCGYERLRSADRAANQRGYLAHEYGDLALLDCHARPPQVNSH